VVRDQWAGGQGRRRHRGQPNNRTHHLHYRRAAQLRHGPTAGGSSPTVRM